MLRDCSYFFCATALAARPTNLRSRSNTQCISQSMQSSRHRQRAITLACAAASQCMECNERSLHKIREQHSPAPDDLRFAETSPARAARRVNGARNAVNRHKSPQTLDSPVDTKGGSVPTKPQHQTPTRLYRDRFVIPSNMTCAWMTSPNCEKCFLIPSIHIQTTERSHHSTNTSSKGTVVPSVVSQLRPPTKIFLWIVQTQTTANDNNAKDRLSSELLEQHFLPTLVVHSHLSIPTWGQQTLQVLHTYRVSREQ